MVDDRADRGAFALSSLDGTPLFYERAVRGDGVLPPLVLLDGIGCDGYVWKHLRAELSSARAILHPHYRGHGRSPAPRDSERVGIADLADDVADAMDDAGLTCAVVIGHSMGVQVALELTRRHPERVQGLALMCGAPENPLRTFRRTSALEAALPGIRRAVARAPRLLNAVARALLPTQLAFDIAGRLEINRDLISAVDFMPYLRGLSRIELPFFLALLAAAGAHSARDLLPTLRIPVLVVAGARDGFTPPELSRAMAEEIPDAELLLIEDGTHTAPLERPERIGAALRDFLARRIGRAPTGST